MSDQTALLAAIRAHPDDDTPRLIYADWLDEHAPDKTPTPSAGPSARAEFIRVQCRLAQRPYDDPEYPALLERETELDHWLKAHTENELPELPHDLDWHGPFTDTESAYRGFPEGIEFSDYDEDSEENIERIVTALPEAFANTTARTLSLDEAYGSEVAGVVRHKCAAELRGLLLPWIEDDNESEAIRGIADADHLTNLRHLDFGFDVPEADARTLAKAAHLNALESFVAYHLSAAGVRALAGAKWFRNLRELQVGLNNRETFKAISELPPMPNLVRLALHGHHAPTATAVRKFVSSRSFPKLARLEFEDLVLTPEAVEALAKATWPLRHLKLEGVKLRKAGAAALAGAEFASSLRVLELDSNQITAAGVQALSTSEKLAGLRHLKITGNPIGPGGLAALARSPHLRNLRLLDLARARTKQAPVNAAAVLNFLTALDMPDLRHLSLDFLPVGIRGARVIASGDTFAHLTKLELLECGLRETGAKAIIESPALSNLTYLDLTSNNAGKGVAKLASAKTFPRLGYCSMAHNRLPKDVLNKLGKRKGIQFH